MRRSIRAWVLMALVPGALAAKGPTVSIEVSGDTLAEPLAITDADLVARFSIWNGPGVRANGKQVHLDPERQDGRFIDWPKGIAAGPPERAQRYAVLLRIGADNGRAYRLTYAFQPSAEGGYIFLPKANVALISHGVEGNWFYSTPAWEALIRPIIVNAE